MMLTVIRIACVLGLVGVAAGAFGAHGLRGQVNAERLAVFETAVRYQLLHVPALLFLGALGERLRPRWAELAAWLLVVGILIFSGSLYLLVLLDRGWLGAITPLGGIALMGGWLCLAVAATGRRRPAD